MLGVGGLAAAHGSLELPETDGGGDPYTKSDKWDLSWIKRVKGKARGVFDMTSPQGNGGWDTVITWRDHAIEVYGKARDVNAIAVIRHAGITLAMNDAYWDEFKIGQSKPRGDTTAATAPAAPVAPLRNPIASPRPGASDAQLLHSVECFIADGGIVLACNLAFSGMVRSRVARARNLTGAAADKAARAYLIPGVILMPSGVFALIAAQQAGCGVVPGLVPSSPGAS
jgi:hypothetical protein